MAAGLRAVEAASGLIDVVLEVRDARMPKTTAVTSTHPRLKSKRRYVLLNRQDLADPAATRAWAARLSQTDVPTFVGVGTKAATLRELRAALRSHKGRGPKTRVAVVGAPNTGKSSVINALVGRNRTVVRDKAGVTRHVSWIALDDRVDILDTPGVLEPRITSDTAAWQLALCGILPESAFDAQDVVARFGMWASKRHAKNVNEFDLETFARQHGMLRRGGEIDSQNAAQAFLKEFRAGKLGRFTFESSEDRV